MNNNSTLSDQSKFKRAKFVFESLEKFVEMDVFLKVALDDLKFSFSRILNLDFFGKKFDYYFMGDSQNTPN